MKDFLAEIIRKSTTPEQARNIMREYLQVRILAALQRAGAMIPLAFHGGTALRLLYSGTRYSEDLDFALEGNADHYDFRRYLRRIQSELSAEGYQLSLKVSDKKVVHSAFVRFPGLFFEMGVSLQREETLAVKLEVDTRPPAGAHLTTSIIRRYLTINLQHHDPSSLLAGKLHAFLQRNYVKGRDVYDLFWYLSSPDWPEPNLIFLNNALQQTGWQGGELTAANWREVIAERIEGLDWRPVLDDVRPFVAHPTEVDLLTRENMLRLLQK